MTHPSGPARPEPDKTRQSPAPSEPPQYPTASVPPQHPTASGPPQYPAASAPPQYPAASAPPQYPASAPPPYPAGALPPQNLPGTAPTQNLPGAVPEQGFSGTGSPQYPQSSAPAAPPQYPGAPPQYPAPEPPQYPTGSTPPQDARAAAPPQYPGSPAPAAQPPSPSRPAAPQYPTASAPPQYPTGSVPPQYPTAPPPAPVEPQPGAGPRTAEAPAAVDDPSHPHHIETDTGRAYVSARQRHTDATAIGNLLILLPHFLCSLFVVALVSLLFGGMGFVVVLAWLASGALVFHRPTESAIARHLLKLRYPTPEERARLEPVWRTVSSRAGVEGRTYELWIEDSDSLNAVAAAGHIVGVTRFALGELPNGELAAVLAHELGHHVGGHAWSSLLGYWYALPGRLAWRLLRALSRGVFAVSRAFSCFGFGLVLLVFGTLAMLTISSLYGLPLLILGVPYALAAVGRRSELRADRHAAELGFAPMLAAVLHKLHQADERHSAEETARNGGVPLRESPLSKLLASHPDHYTRLHHLQPYLQQRQR
ncbi:M48 family metalloprotease [Streptomyces sp. NPDC002004]